MSDLTPKEKLTLENLFCMSSGYVLNFTNRTFYNFFAEFDIDIDSEKYQMFCSNPSKASKLRTFLIIEDNNLVGSVLLKLIKHAEKYFNTIRLDLEHKNLIEQCKNIAERLCYGHTRLESLKNTSNDFGYYLNEQIQRMENAIATADPALAIGTAKELIETCCKTILKKYGQEVSGCPDIPTLNKNTLKQLKLVPEGIPKAKRGSDIIKRLLQNLGTIVNNLAELRNLYGTGHGKEGKTKGLNVRHAKLAVGAASTLVHFLFDTYKENDTK
jgi:hypothetical protein